jgi:bacteriocin biosynthesis cyclodehydratase domain-containing protein
VTRAEPTPRTVLHPAGRLLWRAPQEAQVEVGSRRVVIAGVGTEAVRHLIGKAAGGNTADTAGTTDAADGVAALQRALVEVGLLWPRWTDNADSAGSAQSAGGAADLRFAPPRPRLAPELTALAARAGETASELLSARRHASVVVHGAGRAGAHLAAILAAAGVGRVHVADTATVRLHHAVPGGLTPADEGAPLAQAATTAIHRHAPDADCLPLPFGERPDLVVLALDAPIDGERRNALHARGCAHLLVRLSSAAGVIGPLVLPGLTSCLRCADLHRLDRDPAWNALAVQLTLPHRANVASEVALATVIAGFAAMQALEFLDGGRPATIEGALEMALPDWRVRRRTWPVHPDCDCMQEMTS